VESLQFIRRNAFPFGREENSQRPAARGARGRPGSGKIEKGNGKHPILPTHRASAHQKKRPATKYTTTRPTPRRTPSGPPCVMIASRPVDARRCRTRAFCVTPVHAPAREKIKSTNFELKSMLIGASSAEKHRFDHRAQHQPHAPARHSESLPPAGPAVTTHAHNLRQETAAAS